MSFGKITCLEHKKWRLLRISGNCMKKTGEYLGRTFCQSNCQGHLKFFGSDKIEKRSPVTQNFPLKKK